MSFMDEHRKVADKMVDNINSRDKDSTITKLDIENYGRFLDTWNMRHAIEAAVTKPKEKTHVV